VKPGEYIKIIKGDYKNKTGFIRSRSLWGLIIDLNIDLGEYWISQSFWKWELQKPLKYRDNVILAKHRFKA